MNNNFSLIKKTLSLLLILTILMTISSNVLAVDTLENNQVSMLSEEEPVGGLFGDASAWLLEKLAGGAISSLGGRGMNAAIGGMFGSSSDGFDHAAAAEKFLNEIHGVKEDISNLQGQLNTLSSWLIGKMNYGELKKDLDDFAIYINQYVGSYNDLCDIQNSCANDAELTELIAKKIYFGEDRNLWVDGKTTYNATIALGNRLVLVLQGGYNIFGAFDKMDRYKNRWENQGYASRNEFRDNLIKIYAQYSAMSKLSCKIIYGQLGDSVEDRALREMTMNRWNQLCANAEMVRKMYERCAVVEHPDYRIYRDTSTGTDLYTFQVTAERAKMSSIDFSEGEPLCSKYIYGNKDFYYSMTRTKDDMRYEMIGRSRWMYSLQPEVEQLRRIYTDYQKDNPGKTISMYDIFFSKKEGAFINNTGLGQGARFATNRYTIATPISNWIDYGCKTDLVCDNGEVINDFVLAHYQFVMIYSYRYMISFSHVSRDSYINHDAFWISINKYNGPALDQGNLQENQEPNLPPKEPDNLITGMATSYELPYSENITLSVEEKPGTTYQWYIDNGDGNQLTLLEGEITSAYSLPKLEPSMNGLKYRCSIVENIGTGQVNATLSDPVTLILTGGGIPALETIHDVSNIEELKTALEKVADGTWTGHTIKLTANITYANTITLVDSSVNIDLNGYTLTIKPCSDSEPNINPKSNSAEIAAIYTLRSNLYVNNGYLNVIAGQNIDYGVYAYSSEVTVNNITCTDRGTAAYATDSSSIEITGNVSANGDNAYAIECNSGSTVRVGGNVSAEGNTSCGVYAESYNELRSLVEIDGDIVVSGANSQGAFLNAKLTVMKVKGNVTVTGASAAGISAGGGDSNSRCTVIIFGNVEAPVDAVNAWDSADVRIHGNVTATEDTATAVLATGAMVNIYGNITSEGKESTGISISAFDLVDIIGSMVKADGKITAYTPLRIDGMPVEENEHSDGSVFAGYYTFTDGTNTAWVKQGSFIIISDIDPNPQTGDSLNVVYLFVFGISVFVLKRRRLIHY